MYARAVAYLTRRTFTSSLTSQRYGRTTFVRYKGQRSRGRAPRSRHARDVTCRPLVSREGARERPGSRIKLLQRSFNQYLLPAVPSTTRESRRSGTTSDVDHAINCSKSGAWHCHTTLTYTLKKKSMRFWFDRQPTASIYSYL